MAWRTAIMCPLVFLGVYTKSMAESGEIPPFSSWKASGEAGAWLDAPGAVAEQLPVYGFKGDSLLNSYTAAEEDGSVGELWSPPFLLTNTWMNFLIGGGRHPDTVYMALMIDGHEVRRATGHNGEVLRWESWDVSESQSSHSP